jgi:HSP20 family protein
MYGPLGLLSHRLREFEDFLGNGGETTFQPALDIHEDAERFTVEMEVPGLKPGEIEVTFAEGQLTVKGSRAWEKKEGTVWHRRERASGSFERTVSFPVAVNGEKIDASFQDGVLSIRLPKSEEAKPRKVTVRIPEAK